MSRIEQAPSQVRSLKSVAEAFLLHKTWDGCARKTLDWYQYRLSHFGAWLERQPSQALDITTLRGYLDWCTREAGYAKASLAHAADFLKAFFTWAHREGLIPTNPAATLAKIRLPKQFPHVLTQQQVRLLLKQPLQRTWEGFRNYVMLLILLDSGVRRNELLGLRLADVNLYAQQLRIHGKGAKDRTVPIGRTAAKHLHRWLERRGDVPAEDTVFITRQGEPLTPRNFNQIVLRYARRAGIKGTRVSPHSLRHTMATEFVRNGGDIFSLKAILGHEDIQTLQIYVHMAGVAAQEQHRKFSPVEHLLRG